jgi:hypothetical protein
MKKRSKALVTDEDYEGDDLKRRVTTMEEYRGDGSKKRKITTIEEYENSSFGLGWPMELLKTHP